VTRKILRPEVTMYNYVLLFAFNFGEVDLDNGCCAINPVHHMWMLRNVSSQTLQIFEFTNLSMQDRSLL